MDDQSLLATLKFLATGLVRWHKNFIDSGSTYSYPADLRIGLDRLAGQSLSEGLDFPRDIPDALEWFHKPLQSWPQLQDKTLFTEEESLFAGGQPAETCYELALDGDVEQELTEQLMVRVLNLCRERGTNDDYVRFRRFLIEHPVLDKRTLVHWAGDNRNGVAASLLGEAYEELPPSTQGPDNQNYKCDYCGWVLDWRGNQAKCIHTYCAEKTNHFRRRKACDTAGFVRLKRGIMRFVAWPGKWELKLEKDLYDLKAVQVELWPGFDAYDLRITFPHGEVWAVDVKDWRNPYLLAKNVTPFSSVPEWHKAFWIVPNHYWRIWSRYDQEFARFRPLQKNESIKSLKGFLHTVRARLESEG